MKRPSLSQIIALSPLVVILAVLSVLGYYNFHKKSEFQPRAMVGQMAPDMRLTNLKDGSVSDLQALSKAYDRPILVNVFASWCTPCLGENPKLLELRAQNIPIIGIAYKDKPANSQNFLSLNGDPYQEVLNDDQGQLGLRLGISGVPETYLISKDGVILDKIGGPVTDENLAPLLAKLETKKP